MTFLPISAQAEMHGALVPIASQIVTGSSVSGITFNNIPQGYQDLMAVCYVRSTNSSTDYFYVNPNNNGSGIGSFTTLYGNGSSTGSYRDSSQSINIELREFTGSNQTSGIFTSVTMHILNYANTSAYKTILSRNASDWNGSGFTHLTVNMMETTSGISSLKFAGYSGNLAVGSQIQLYGIRTVGQ